MTDFTPGPWTWNPGKGSDQGSIEPDICWFGDDTTYYPTGGEPPNDANARLIAAAPDLLAALGRFVAHYPSGINPMLDDAAIEARTAIAKAKGKT